MTIARAAPGQQLSHGRLRVDAAKAIAKLREYQLADRSAWILEAIRAAVASGATRIDLSGDANDVWLAWEGPPWPAADLPKLFDELVSPEPTAERQHLRLLAAAVNSALGMEPAFVDVYAVGEQVAMRARYTPEVLVERADGESPLRELQAVPASAPARVAPTTGMLVHLRRRAALGMITYLFWEREPRELHVARAACRDLPVPLHVGKTVLHRDRGEHDVVRLPLGDGLDGFVAVMDPDLPRSGEHRAVLDVAERGVLLASYPIDLGWPDARTPVPLRLFIDAPRMPTNASRSQVRREAHPIAEAERRGDALAARVLDELARLASLESPSPRVREAVLALVAARVCGPAWSTELELAATQLGALGRIPIARDATGAPQPLVRAWRGFVHTGTDPLPAEQAPWLGDVMWAPPDDPVRRLFEGCELDGRAMRRRARWARRQARAHRRFFEHAPRPATLAAARPARIRGALGTPVHGTSMRDDLFEGITGELGVFPGRLDGELVLLLEGRELDRVRVPSPVGFEAVIDSKALTPMDGYRGVVEDDAYRRCVTAARAGAVRAVEALALGLASQPLPRGFTAEPAEALPADRGLVGDGLALALTIAAHVGATLERAPVWQTVDGRLVTLAELRACTVLGIAPSRSTPFVPKGRIVLQGVSESLLRQAVPHARLVEYTPYRTRGASAERLAGRLAASTSHALEVTGDGLVGAIALAAGSSTLQLVHLGCELERRSYTPKLLAHCQLAVDSEAIVPSATWNAAEDDAGVASRDYTSWERELVRALARAIVGERPAALHGPAVGGLDSEAGRALCHALAKQDPTELLGADLLRQLRTQRLVRLLGEPDRVAIDDLAKRFPSFLSVVGPTATPVAGFAPIVADELVGRALGVLTGKPVREGKTDLELRRRVLIRDQRLAEHRARPEQPLVFPAALPHVAIAPAPSVPQLRGFVGLGAGRLELRVSVESRPFTTVFREAALPLLAIVDVGLGSTTATFDALTQPAIEAIVRAIEDTAPAVIAAVAASQPDVLATRTPARTLVGELLDRGPLPTATARALLELCRLPTLGGAPATLEHATQPHGVLSIAEWSGEWLGPLASESPHELDRPIVRVTESDSELHGILRAICASVVDVGAEVERLQARRRMERGLVPRPALPHVAAPWKRALAELGAQEVGELGLVETGVSTVIVHAGGEPRHRIHVDVLPAVELAIEAPDLIPATKRRPDPGSAAAMIEAFEASWAELERAMPPPGSDLPTRTQALANTLVERVLAATPADQLPPALRRSLRGALLAWRLPEAMLGGAPVFETQTGAWIAWHEVAAQIALFGDVWATTGPLAERPLDERRLVLVLTAAELAAARGRITIVDAAHELALDARARRNRARPAATRLALHHPESLLAQITLDGDGVTAPCGVVGVLRPEHVERRGLYAHRAMHPFDVVDDPCAWPTVAVVDDARLEPNRTWERPHRNGAAWTSLVAQVRAASERALVASVPIPVTALASELVGTTAGATNGELRNGKVQVRGALWISGAPGEVASLELVAADASRTIAPLGRAGLGGRLYVTGAEITDYEVTSLCAAVYRTLLRELLRRDELDPDLALAHVAHAISAGRIHARELGKLRFPCFRPAALDATQLEGLLRGSGEVQVVGVGDEPDLAGLVDDDTLLSRVLLGALGARARRGRPAPTAPSPPITAPPPVAPARPRPPTPPPPHPIDIVVDAVKDRLRSCGYPGVDVGTSAGDEPIAAVANSLRLARDNRRLHAIANALRAESPWAPAAIDALVAHAVTLLNNRLTAVTDSVEQRVLEVLLQRPG